MNTRIINYEGNKVELQIIKSPEDYRVVKLRGTCAFAVVDVMLIEVDDDDDDN